MAIVNVKVGLRKDSKVRKITYIPRYMANRITEGTLISIEYHKDEFISPPEGVQHFKLLYSPMLGISDTQREELLNWLELTSGHIVVQCEMGMVRSKHLANYIHEVFDQPTMLIQEFESQGNLYKHKGPFSPWQITPL